MKIKVIYLARLSEDMGKKEEYIEISESESTIKDIYLKLNLDKLNYKIYSAKNFEHSEFDSNIKDNDEVAFSRQLQAGSLKNYKKFILVKGKLSYYLFEHEL